MTTENLKTPMWTLDTTGVSLYRSINEANKDPNEMIPLLPGESIHIGYLPISEEDAFANYEPDLRFEMGFSKIKSFLLPRGAISCDRIALLIHKFNYLNWGVRTFTPKRESLNTYVPKSIYGSLVDFKTFRGKRATMSITVRALSQPTEDGETAQFIEIEVYRISGSCQIHQLYANSLESYIRSNGSESAFISQTVENTTRWRAPIEWKKQQLPTDDDSDTESSLDGERGYVRPVATRRFVDEDEDDDLSPRPRPSISVQAYSNAQDKVCEPLKCDWFVGFGTPPDKIETPASEIPAENPATPDLFSHETPSGRFSGESFNSYVHSSRNCPKSDSLKRLKELIAPNPETLKNIESIFQELETTTTNLKEHFEQSAEKSKAEVTKFSEYLAAHVGKYINKST